jgi:hypothetical protein
VIRLSEADHANWRDRVAPDLPDLDAWLAERDQRLAQLPPDDRRRRDWFWHVSGALAGAQQDWAEKRRRGLVPPSRPRAAAAGAGRARPHLGAAPGGPVTTAAASAAAAALGDRRRERERAAG